MDYNKIEGFVAVMVPYEDYEVMRADVDDGLYASIQAGQPVVNNSFERIVIGVSRKVVNCSEYTLGIQFEIFRDPPFP